MFDSHFLKLLVYTVPMLAVGIVGLVFGFRVRSRNNSAGLLTIVGWGMVVFSLIMNFILEVLLWRSIDHAMKLDLYFIFGGINGLLIAPVALGCILLGILGIASSGTSSVRYQPLDLHATGNR
jgi:hypothetical protein